MVHQVRHDAHTTPQAALAQEAERGRAAVNGDVDAYTRSKMVYTVTVTVPRSNRHQGRHQIIQQVTPTTHTYTPRTYTPGICCPTIPAIPANPTVPRPANFNPQATTAPRKPATPYPSVTTLPFTRPIARFRLRK